MKKALFVLAMLVSLPVMAEAQWGAPSSFVYIEQQSGYPHTGMPQVIYPAPPPVMYPAPPQVIYTPPPQVMIQLQPALPPQVVVQVPRPAGEQPHRHYVLKSGGATIITRCSNCTVNNTIKVKDGVKGGRVVVKRSHKPAPKPSATSPSADSWLAVLLVAAAMVTAVIVLLAIVINQRMTRPRTAPSPTPAPAPVSASNTRADAARRSSLRPRPEPLPTAPVVPIGADKADSAAGEEGRHKSCDIPKGRVHRRKCDHPDCNKKVEICCHAENGGTLSVSVPGSQAQRGGSRKAPAARSARPQPQDRDLPSRRGGWRKPQGAR